MELSKTDRIGCVFIQLGEAINQIDDKFADETGNIHIAGIGDVIELASLGYETIQKIYVECLGKEFTVNVPGTAGELINFLIKLLLNDAGGGVPASTTPRNTTV